MEDAADQWVPPGGDLRSRGPLVSGKKRGEGVGAGGEAGPRLTARAGPREKIGSGPREKKKGGGGSLGLWAKTRGESSSLFIFCPPFSFKNKIYFKTFSKPNLNSL